jgi:hypothetical protein
MKKVDLKAATKSAQTKVNAHIRNVLMNEGNCKFTVKGHTTYGKDENGEWKDNVLKTFHMGSKCESIWCEYHGMNVQKFGPTCVTLYAYDMLSKKTVGKIKYSDITIIG